MMTIVFSNFLSSLHLTAQTVTGTGKQNTASSVHSQSFCFLFAVIGGDGSV